SRLSRAHCLRFLNGPSVTSKVSCRKCPVPALLGFISLSVITAKYLPAGMGSKSVDGSTWLASNPCKSAIVFHSFFRKCRDKRRPRQRQVVGDSVTVLGNAGGSAHATQDALAAVFADRVGDGALAIEAGVLGVRANLARGEQHGIGPFAN